MAEATNYAEFAKVFDLDDVVRERIRTAWSIVQPELKSILSIFYDKWMKIPKLATMIGDRRSHLIEAQSKHWQGLFSARFDAEYVESASRVGRAHVRIGLEPHWYIAGYSEVLSRMGIIIGKSRRFSGAKAAELIDAVTRAVMLDLDLAISVYHNIQVQMATEKQDRVQQAVKEFDGSMRSMLAGLENASRTLGETAKKLDLQATTTVQKAVAINEMQEMNARGINVSAAATEELHASIGEIGRQSESSREVADQAVEGAKRTSVTVEGLSVAADRIGSVIELISAIASQTNLLALNATIEAARAGELGRGFTVVASEVKSLALQTTKATDEITQQISSIQDATRKSVEDIQGITKTIDEVARIGASIAASVEEQSAATREIAHNVQNSATTTEEVKASLIDIRKGSDEISAVAGNVSTMAHDLEQQSATLDSAVRAFISKVLAA